MYEKAKTHLETIKQQITYKCLIVGAICLLLLVGIGQLARGYFTARGNYQRAIDKLERTQRELDTSRRLNQELKLVIERSSDLNRQASDRIKRIEDYQRRTEQGIGRAQSYQQETGRRVSESIGTNSQASELIGRSLRIIERVESGNKE
uniref:Cell division protein n=1 Tax=Myoviridae sp. cteaT5 TaxID=2826676 RepID=A0A8S5NQU5_9CAUD|nr:MAG TPA: cell division protein [Myoviridae sp. cteaT5]